MYSMIIYWKQAYVTLYMEVPRTYIYIDVSAEATFISAFNQLRQKPGASSIMISSTVRISDGARHLATRGERMGGWGPPRQTMCFRQKTGFAFFVGWLLLSELELFMSHVSSRFINLALWYQEKVIEASTARMKALMLSGQGSDALGLVASLTHRPPGAWGCNGRGVKLQLHGIHKRKKQSGVAQQTNIYKTHVLD